MPQLETPPNDDGLLNGTQVGIKPLIGCWFVERHDRAVCRWVRTAHLQSHDRLRLLTPLRHVMSRKHPANRS